MSNTTVEAPGDVRLDRTRAGRYAARHVLWDETSLDRVKACGRRVVAKGQGVAVKVAVSPEGKRTAGYAGVQHCGSVWACPVCSAKIAEGRRVELAQAIAAWTAQGGKVALATFTMRHRKGQRLRTLWDALTYAWSKTTSGRAWGKDKDLAGVEGWCRVVEVTEGEAGWHVHVHALIFLRPDAAGHFDTDEDRAGYLEGAMWGRWVNALNRKGLSALRSVGADVKVLDGTATPETALGDYFTKAVYRPTAESASYEVARGDLKDGRFGNRTPFQILADLVASGDLDDLDAWHEWERASVGRRQIGWSKGMRALLLTEPEKDDQELADAERAGEVVATIDRDTYDQIVRERADWLVLDAFQTSEQAGMETLLGLSARAAHRLSLTT